MQAEFLNKLSQSVQDFIVQLEQSFGFEITVIPDIRQNGGGSTGQGKLAINVQPNRIQLFAPTNGYFPDGAVKHELLHAKRFHLDGVPKLVLADDEAWDGLFADALCNLDNALKHLVIVPIELDHHPERNLHWELLMGGICSELPNVPEKERRLAVLMHWTFLRHVLPRSPSVDALRDFAIEYNLFEEAERFADQLINRLDNKEELVSQLFLAFPEISKERSALEYINGPKGRYQTPIPS